MAEEVKNPKEPKKVMTDEMFRLLQYVFKEEQAQYEDFHAQE